MHKKNYTRQERIEWNSVRNKGKLCVFTVAPACLAMSAYRNTALLKNILLLLK